MEPNVARVYAIDDNGLVPWEPRHDSDHGTDKLALPGGKRETNKAGEFIESIIETAAREFEEETGVSIRKEDLEELSKSGDNGYQTLFLFLRFYGNFEKAAKEKIASGLIQLHKPRGIPMEKIAFHNDIAETAYEQRKDLQSL